MQHRIAPPVREHQVETKAQVVAVLEPAVRPMVETAVNGAFAVVHADDVDDALKTLRGSSAQALLVSLRAIERRHVSAIGRMVAECPTVLPVALITERSTETSERLLQLGAQGVNQLLDLNDRDGWCKLRRVVADSGGEVGQRILVAVMARLTETSTEARHFFAVLIRLSPQITTVRQLAVALDMVPSTLMSRFFRARLPSPKRYLAGIRLVYASAYLEVPSRSIAQVSGILGYSSPQSFGRHVRHVLGMSAGSFRRDYSFTAILEHHVATLVEPYARRFHSFEPFRNDEGGAVRGARERHLWETA